MITSFWNHWVQSYKGTKPAMKKGHIIRPITFMAGKLFESDNSNYLKFVL